jgi:hypothetical protein
MFSYLMSYTNKNQTETYEWILQWRVKRISDSILGGKSWYIYIYIYILYWNNDAIKVFTNMIFSHCKTDFLNSKFSSSILVLAQTQSSAQYVLSFFPWGWSRQERKLTSHLHLAHGLRMCRAITLLQHTSIRYRARTPNTITSCSIKLNTVPYPKP